MRTAHLPALATAAALFCSAPAPGQTPPKPPPAEFEALVKVVENAYKAPHEVEKDVLDELRKQYRGPTPEREAKIFKEIRRVYEPTAGQADDILREVRRAYESPTAAQEERVLEAIRRSAKMPLGTIPALVQADRAEKLFRRYDRDSDGLLANDELPEGLSDQRKLWDKNCNGLIDLEEYATYYGAQLKMVSDAVARGEVSIRAPIAPAAAPEPTRAPMPRPAAKSGTGLPDWFGQLDTNADGQVGLYEWKKAGRKVADFLAMDANGDGYLEAGEVQAYLAGPGKTQK